jgi:hypothetical protein
LEIAPSDIYEDLLLALPAYCSRICHVLNTQDGSGIQLKRVLPTFVEVHLATSPHAAVKRRTGRMVRICAIRNKL